MLRPMSDARQNLLVKCAGDVVDLCNCSVEPTEALTKVAADAGLNSNEIDRVSHKVNQALTLGYLQSSAPQDRGKAFPLTNAEQAKTKLFKQQPETTEADLAKGQTFNPIKTLKEASDSDYLDFSSYNTYDHTRTRSLTKLANDVRVPAPELPAYEKRPTASNEKIAYEIARESYQAVRNELSNAMSSATQPFIYAGSPDFGGVAKVAQDMGVSPSTLNICFGMANLAKYGQKPESKTAGYVNTKLAQEFVRVEHLINACGVAKSQMDEAKVAFDNKVKLVQNWKKASDAPALAKVDYGGATEAAEGIFNESMGGHENGPGGMLGEALGVREGDNGPVAPLSKSLHEKDIDQGIRNTDAKSVLQDAMHDPYIGGHGIPRVVDAINRANSLHPNLSPTEILSYVRQDLATDGGVPLDTHLRMIQAHKDKV